MPSVYTSLRFDMTRGVADFDLRNRAITLRVEGRKSFAEIESELGVPRSNLSAWLKPYPLTPEELSARQKARGRPVKRRTLTVRGEESKFHQLSANLTPHQVASVAEAAVQFRLALHGFRVYRALHDGDRIDFLVGCDGRFLKLQVKSLQTPKTGAPLLRLWHVTGHNTKTRYTPDDVDFIVGYWLYNDTAYVYAMSELSQKTMMAVTPGAAEAWQKLLV
jgi:hypothetical protein